MCIERLLHPDLSEYTRVLLLQDADCAVAALLIDQYVCVSSLLA